MTTERIIYSNKVEGVHCRSAAELLRLKVSALPGVEAVSLSGDSVLTVFADRYEVTTNDIARTIVEAGLVPTGDTGWSPVLAHELAGVELGVAQAAELAPLHQAVAEVFEEAAAATSPAPARASLVQRVHVQVADSYYPDTLSVIPGVPVQIEFSEGHGCLSRVLFEQFGVDQDLTEGGAIVALPGLAPGEYEFSCGMHMVFGRVVAEA